MVVNSNYTVLETLIKYRQFYIGVNSKCPETFHPIFLPDEVTQAQTWGTVLTPY